jgi:hypothetical protein
MKEGVRQVRNTCPCRQIAFQSEAKTYVHRRLFKERKREGKEQGNREGERNTGTQQEKISSRLRQAAE